MPLRNFLTATQANDLYTAGLEDGADDSALDNAVVMLASEADLAWWYAPAREATERRDELDDRQIWTSEGVNSIRLGDESSNPPRQVDITDAELTTRRTELLAVPRDIDTGRP